MRHSEKHTPWSKLQREVYKLVAPGLAFQIHCVACPMDSYRGSTDLPRYWITFQKEIVWDYPKDFMTDELIQIYPYGGDISAISDVIREYIDTPKELLFDKAFDNDKWGLTDILKSVDRRIGKRRLVHLGETLNNSSISKIIAERLGKITE